MVEHAGRFAIAFVLLTSCTVDVGGYSDESGGGDNGGGDGSGSGSGGGTVTGPEFGVLASDPTYAADDYAAGIRWASIELDWAAIEPARGQFDAAGIPTQRIATYRAAGWKIELSLGLHGNPPEWAATVEPWMDQTGATQTTNGPNWFSATVQKDIDDYITYVIQTIGPTNIDAVRIGGTSNAGEVDYPIGDQPYRYSAFSASALAGTPLIPKNPAPSCKPPTCSATDAPIFLAWYVDSLSKFCNHQVETIRTAGYQGDVSWLFAGGGISPGLKTLMLANGLGPSTEAPDDYGVASAGLDEPELIGKIADKGTRTVIVNTGVNDSTIATADEASTDPELWSAPHWTAYNADKYMLRKAGENVGYTADGYDSAARMQLAFDTMKKYGYGKLMWAFDKEMRTANGAKIEDYKRLIDLSRQ